MSSDGLNFKVVLEKDESGWFTATVPSLPGCISQGKNEKEALKNIKEAIGLHLTSLAEDGIPIKDTDNRKVKTVAVSV